MAELHYTNETPRKQMYIVFCADIFLSYINKPYGRL